MSWWTSFKAAWDKLNAACVSENPADCGYDDTGILGVLPVIALVGAAVLLVGLVIRAVAIYKEERKK